MTDRSVARVRKSRLLPVAIAAATRRKTERMKIQPSGVIRKEKGRPQRLP